MGRIEQRLRKLESIIQIDEPENGKAVLVWARLFRDTRLREDCESPGWDQPIESPPPSEEDVCDARAFIAEARRRGKTPSTTSLVQLACDSE